MLWAKTDRFSDLLKNTPKVIDLIESTQNKIVKKLISLKSRKNRDKDGLFVAEGIRFVSEIPADWKVDLYAVSKEFAAQNEIRVFEERANTFVFSQSVFETLSDTEHPQGILAVCHRKKFDLQAVLEKKTGFYLLAEELNDPGNLGTIIRTADACGVHGIFLSKGSVDLYNPKVLRSTMGSLFHIPVFQNVDLGEIVGEMKKKDVQVLAAHLKGLEYPYAFDFKKSCAILIGNEARGLSEEATTLCDDFVKIPMIGQAESLNASIAAGVLMYEAVRQRIMK